MIIHPRLKWPAGVDRTLKPISSRFSTRSVNQAVELLAQELERFGHRDATVTLDLRMDRSVRAGFRMISEVDGDQGVAVYFKKGEADQVLAIDRYDLAQDNIWALVRTIDALRQIEREGGPSILSKAMEGFAALPAPCPFKSMGLDQSADAQQVEAKFKDLAKSAHPDAGGSSEDFTRLQATRDLALTVIKQREEAGS